MRGKLIDMKAGGNYYSGDYIDFPKKDINFEIDTVEIYAVPNGMNYTFYLNIIPIKAINDEEKDNVTAIIDENSLDFKLDKKILNVAGDLLILYLDEIDIESFNKSIMVVVDEQYKKITIEQKTTKYVVGKAVILEIRLKLHIKY